MLAALPDPDLAQRAGDVRQVAATVTAAAGGDIKAVAAAAEEARHVRKL